MQPLEISDICCYALSIAAGSLTTINLGALYTNPTPFITNLFFRVEKTQTLMVNLPAFS